MEKLSKQGFPYDTKTLFEPVTKIVKKTAEKLLRTPKARSTAIENAVGKNHGLVIFFAKTQTFFAKELKTIIEKEKERDLNIMLAEKMKKRDPFC